MGLALAHDGKASRWPARSEVRSGAGLVNVFEVLWEDDRFQPGAGRLGKGLVHEPAVFF